MGVHTDQVFRGKHFGLYSYEWKGETESDEVESYDIVSGGEIKRLTGFTYRLPPMLRTVLDVRRVTESLENWYVST